MINYLNDRFRKSRLGFPSLYNHLGFYKPRKFLINLKIF